MLEKFKKVESKLGKITKSICYISFVGLLAIMFLNVADVLGAKLASPILGSYEITSRLLLCTVFAAFAYAQTQKAHINMTLVISRFPRALKFAFFTLMSFLSVGIAGFLTYAAYFQAGVAREGATTTEILFIPLYPFFYVQAIAMAAFTAILLFDAIMSLFAIFRNDFAEHVMASWE